MEIRKATANDWDLLLPFYKKVYRPAHPLQDFAFFDWQFGNHDYGMALIAIDGNQVVGHLGLNFVDGYAWHINLFVLESHRSSSVLLSMIDMAGSFGKQGNIAANESAVKLYRMLGWYQYINLIRLTCINPAFQEKPIQDIVSAIPAKEPQSNKPQSHFWEQPTLQGIELPDGSTAIVQDHVGALRFVEIRNIAKAVDSAWQSGYKWIDFVTSFNNPMLQKLEKKGWKTDIHNRIPWLLNPVVENNFADITFLTKEPIDISFYINRTHADIGRVGSITRSSKV